MNFVALAICTTITKSKLKIAIYILENLIYSTEQIFSVLSYLLCSCGCVYLHPEPFCQHFNRPVWVELFSNEAQVLRPVRYPRNHQAFWSSQRRHWELLELRGRQRAVSVNHSRIPRQSTALSIYRRITGMKYTIPLASFDRFVLPWRIEDYKVEFVSTCSQNICMTNRST